MSSDEIGVILCEVWTELVFIPNLCFAAFFVGTMRFGCKMRFTKLKCISGNPDEAPPGQVSLGRVLPRVVVRTLAGKACADAMELTAKLTR